MFYNKFILFFLLYLFLQGKQLHANPIETLHIDSLINIIRTLSISTHSLEKAQEVLKLSEEVNYTVGKCYAYYDIATYYDLMGDYAKGINYWQALLKLSNATEYSDFLKDAYFGLSRSYLSLDLLEEADEYIKKAIEASTEIKDSTELAMSYAHIGLFYLESERYGEALPYFNDSKKIYKQINSTSSFIEIHYNMGIAYVGTGQIKLAMPYLYEYLNHIKSNQDSLELANVYGNMAWAFQNNLLFEQAFEYFDSSLYYSEKYNQDDITSLTYLDISDTYILKNNYELALDYYKKHNTLENSIASLRVKQHVNELKIKFETEKKERELLSKQKIVDQLKAESQQFLFLLGAIVSGCIIAFLFFLINRRNERNKQKIQAIEKELIRSKLENKEILATRLQEELKNKEVDLTNFAIDIGQKNEFSNRLSENLKDLQKTKPDEIKPKLRAIILLLNNHLSINEDLALLQKNIEKVNQAFFQKLDNNFVGLTYNDKYILGLIRLNLSNKEVARIKGISPSSAKVMRYRLRKKLSLSPKTDIVDFLKKL